MKYNFTNKIKKNIEHVLIGTAKLAKSKGFNQVTQYGYVICLKDYGVERHNGDDLDRNAGDVEEMYDLSVNYLLDNEYFEYVRQPSQIQLHKWLMGKGFIVVVNVYRTKPTTFCVGIWDINEEIEVERDIEISTYEEAMEIGLIRALEQL